MRNLIVLALIVTVSMVACKSTKTATQSVAPDIQIQPVAPTIDNSRNSLDWPGVYQGLVPCADCEGIEMIVVINHNLSYQVMSKYKGNEEVFTEKGTFAWNGSGNKIAFLEPSGTKRQFQVGEDKLVMLDQNGNPIQGALANNYILKKVDNEITEKYWKLIELNGKPVVVKEDAASEPHLIFKIEDSRVFGSGGCNRILGKYELAPGNRIKLSQMAGTLMACLDMEVEGEFMKTLQVVDNYTVKDDTLSLNRARMAPLAKFKCVYLK